MFDQFATRRSSATPAPYTYRCIQRASRERRTKWHKKQDNIEVKYVGKSQSCMDKWRRTRTILVESAKLVDKLCDILMIPRLEPDGNHQSLDLAVV